MKGETHQEAMLVPRRKGGFYYPTVEAPPGLYVEPTRDGERTPLLTEAEFRQYILPLHRRLRSGWTKTGDEIGREYGSYNVRCACLDVGVMDPTGWRMVAVDKEGPAQWAVEYPEPAGTRYLRRRFWWTRVAR